MKNSSYPNLILLLFCLNLQLIAGNKPAGNEILKTGKAEEIKTKFNSGEFSLQSFAFIENKGQVKGVDGLNHPEVKYVFQQGNLQIFLLDKGLAYQFTRLHYPEGYQELLTKKGEPDNFQKLEELQKQIRTETFRMDMNLEGANKNIELSTEGRSEDYTNYYNHNVLDVHNYGKIVYHNVYPGIDWVIYTDKQKLKYDFIVHPGADPNQIQLKFSHQENLQLNPDGSFTLKNSLGEITEQRPISFQSGKEINTRFKKEENSIRFDIGDYNPQQELIIDPSLVWATYYGGISIDNGYSCSTDTSGNVYLAGYALSISGIASGGHQNSFGGGSDASLVKFNASGVRLWGTYYGGNGSDVANSCSTDPSGNVYLVGYSTSTIGIASSGHQNAIGGGNDAFLVKFNGSGVRLWGTYYGGTGNDDGLSCCTDASGNVYIAGQTISSSGIASGGHQNIFGGGTYDAFLAKFNTSGLRIWGTYYGGSGYDYGRSCSTDTSGNVYLVGYSQSSSGIASGGHQNTFGGGSQDVFLVKFSSSGIRIWGTYYGSAASEAGHSCSTDASGNVYLAGYSQSSFGIASGGHQNTFGGISDAFLVKFNASGIRQWATYYGGSVVDNGYSCSTDASGNVYLAGYTESNSAIASGGHQNTIGGGSDAYLVKFNASGIRLWGTYYGGSGGDNGISCSTDASGNVYLAGHTGSSSGIASGGHQNIFGGGPLDAYLVRFNGSNINGNTAICGAGVQTFSIATDPLAINYTWSLPLGWTGTSTTNVISVVPLATGNISVVTNYSASSSTAQTLSVTVNTAPVATISPAGTTTFCPIYSVTLSAPPGMTSYSWSTGATTSTISVNNGGNYSVTLTGTNGCTASSAPVAIINILPSDINKSGTVEVNDYLLFVPAFGTLCNCPEDIDQDGDVDVNDYLLFVPAYGQSCQ